MVKFSIGSVVNLDGQYFITPQAATVMRNANRAAVVDAGTAPVVTEAVAETQLRPIVWITATGKKYHAINNCGTTNPNNASQVPLEHAIARGLTACDKCY